MLLPFLCVWNKVVKRYVVAVLSERVTFLKQDAARSWKPQFEKVLCPCARDRAHGTQSV